MVIRQLTRTISTKTTATSTSTSTSTSTISRIAQQPSFAKNQLIPLQSNQLSTELNSIINSFKPPIRYALAYGSAVFPQNSYQKQQQQPMLDFIFAVTHPSHWHSINLHHHPHHYSLPARLLGSPAISWLQERGPGAGVWFNVETKIHNRMIKYGVVSIDSLCDDLLDWNSLYLSGRMHKPTHILRDDGRVRLAQQVNLSSALRTALLLLPERFEEEGLYRTIAGLSYTGDVRMRWAENPAKVANIVGRQLELFRILYRPLLNALNAHLHPVSQDPMSDSLRVFHQDPSPAARAQLLLKLPLGLKDRIRATYDQRWNLDRAFANHHQHHPDSLISPTTSSSSDELEIWTRIAADQKLRQVIQSALIQIVAKPSLYQSAKGILSAGPIKSLRYATNKVIKRFS
ncbi:Mitochondrial translocator assembly and maintenance protein 41 [Puccinia graminis f. sp. tritici]|uniref:Phosphatidate cytidylyltransferase, mitochondrial n=1 Tax=Puccinia graminis f. sp. tritici TaxID=56615 RepID=A0A5B0S1N4_PUCGR|nr:Mitochondrial translocator assembly and maintenance protein 41 [Puccinia graminis f. sp. tritici]